MSLENVIVVDFKKNFSESKILQQVLSNKMINNFFKEQKEVLKNKLCKCNGGNPDDGFLTTLFAQQRRYNFKLIQGGKDG